MANVTRLTLDNIGDLDGRRVHYRDISDDADAPLASVGEDLRKGRERRGESLDHVARVLKIRQDYLAAVEESTMEGLPGKTYAMGFVRSYANYLGLDGNQYVERLKAEIAGRDDTEPPPPVTVASRVEFKWPEGRWIAGGLLFVALVYSGYLMLSAPETEQPVIPVPDRLAAQAGLPAAQQTPAAPVAAAQPTASAAKAPASAQPASASAVKAPPPAAAGKSPPATSQATPASPAAAAKAALTAQATSASPPTAAAQPAPASPRPTPPPQVTAPAAPPPVASPTPRTPPVVAPTPPQGQRYGAQNTNARITLRVHRQSVVTVRGADDRLYINRILQPGDTYLVPNIAGLRLRALDGGAVEVLLDGSSVGFAGQSGVASELPLSVQGLVERPNPG